ncbi:MAG: exodeoxyribonuclease VII small subunit [Dehalococcoidia bacterium]|nr:exodeoxyribonuclease VII small subunit [Dehalococcoidia bacterium]MSQ34626.1 exodeoxyribonuclease VII small subunit [Dehalococcoidia bacterium]
MPSRTNKKDAAAADASSQGETFEQAFTRLEESVRRLEAGQLTLDDATKIYEEGMRLAKRCSELLARAELRITRLQSEFADQMSLVDEPPEKEDGADGEGDAR